MKDNKALNWLEIQEKIRKPVWDNSKGKWRVIDAYMADKTDKMVMFTDSNAWNAFQEERYYLYEIEVEEGDKE